MSLRDKLRQNKLARQAAGSSLQALLEEQEVVPSSPPHLAALPEAPLKPAESSAGSASGDGATRSVGQNGDEKGAVLPRVNGAANGAAPGGSTSAPSAVDAQAAPPRSSQQGPTTTGLVASPAQPPRGASPSTKKRSRVSEVGGVQSSLPPFSAHGPLPVSHEDLRGCIVRFVCCAPDFGPLPMSAVALNAALRRAYMKAGHSRTGLSVFRAKDTAQAIRAIYKSLEARQCANALALDDLSDGEDTLIMSADTERIYRALISTEMDGAMPDRWPKRHRAFGPGAHAATAPCVFTSTCGVGAPRDLGVMGGIPAPCGGLLPGGGDSERFSMLGRQSGLLASGDVDTVEDLLKAPTARQRQRIDAGEELRILLAEPTARQAETARKFMNKSQHMAQFCPHGSRADCRRAYGCSAACKKIHFKKIIKPWTDESLGDCSYLDTCRHIDKCKYVHYALDLTVDQAQYLDERGVQNRGTDTKRINELAMKGMELPPQWIHADLKRFPLNLFNGLISVVMADPPWDIHMELPYGTLTDDEVRNLKIGDIHKDGMIFLWVTGRAMELARDCFRIWGYKRIEEIVWVKTNQLQRIIRTGRTGHWINHSKEHCLVGIKGNPKINRNLDCDVIVSEVRETSRKPDEIYNLIERMFPNCMKLELFGRPHNVHENWITCGDQLDGVRLADEELVRRYNQQHPDKKTTVWKKEREAVVPLSGVSSSSMSHQGHAGVHDDAPWIPPAAPPAMAPGGSPQAGPHGMLQAHPSPYGYAGSGSPAGGHAASYHGMQAPQPMMPPGYGAYPPPPMPGMWPPPRGHHGNWRAYGSYPPPPPPQPHTMPAMWGAPPRPPGY